MELPVYEAGYAENMTAQILRLAGLLAFAGVAVYADFAAGLQAYQQKDYAAALKEWRPLAESGDAVAQFNLGLMYLDGTGVPQSFMDAAGWFRRAADQGYAKAQYDLGELYSVGKGVKRSYVDAYIWLNICAATGDQKCAAHRDLVAKKLKKRDLEDAQHRAAAWKPKPVPAASSGSPAAPEK